MSKVYNCALGAIKEQLEDFGLDGQPVYQVALSRQSFDMGQAIFSDLNNTYKVFQRYFNDAQLIDNCLKDNNDLFEAVKKRKTQMKHQ